MLAIANRSPDEGPLEVAIGDNLPGFHFDRSLISRVEHRNMSLPITLQHDRMRMPKGIELTGTIAPAR